MANSNGKVILSLLAGATAGAVAGLLLAPETGETTRGSLKQAATDFGGDLSKFFQDTLSKVRGGASADVPNPQAAVSEDRAAADSLFNSMSANVGGSQGAQGAQGAESSYGASQASAFGTGGDNATTVGA